MDGMRARVGLHRCDGGWGEVSEVEVEDAPNPACRAECLPDQKCSQPKRPPAWLPASVLRLCGREETDYGQQDWKDARRPHKEGSSSGHGPPTQGI